MVNILTNKAFAQESFCVEFKAHFDFVIYLILSKNF